MLENQPITEFNAGDIIFSEGDIADAIYLMKTGEVEISSIKDDQKTILARFSKNQIFGEMAVLQKDRRSATATAKTDITCYKIDSYELAERIDSLDPFIKGLYRVMSSHIKHMNKRVAELEFKLQS